MWRISPDELMTKKPLHEYNGLSTVEWFPVACAFLGEDNSPHSAHFMIKMLSDAKGENDKITRGELLCILRVMERLIHSPTFVKYVISSGASLSVIYSLRDSTNLRN